jgi:hypothetical protein
MSFLIRFLDFGFSSNEQFLHSLTIEFKSKSSHFFVGFAFLGGVIGGDNGALDVCLSDFKVSF